MNLINVLKQCIGERFYTTMFGYVTIAKVDASLEDAFPITIYYNGCCGPKTQTWLTKEGHYSYIKDSECVIFPSKEQRSWNKFIKERNIKV